jgi:hypothetical protein
MLTSFSNVEGSDALSFAAASSMALITIRILFSYLELAGVTVVGLDFL